MGRIHMVLVGMVFVAVWPTETSVADGTNGPTEEQIARALRVQAAMVQGRRLLEQGQPAEAVRILERQLPTADGSTVYLSLLRDAYAAELQRRTLTQASAAELQQIRARLHVLDGTDSEEIPKSAPKPQRPPQPAVVASSRPEIVEDDPFQQTPLDDLESTRQVVPSKPSARSTEAFAAFQAKEYRRAVELFAEARRAGEELTHEQQNAWAYSRLSFVVAALNHESGPEPDWKQISGEIAECQELISADGLRAFSDQLAAEVVKRTGTSRPVVRASDPGEKWQTISTANFRVYYRGDAQLAQKAADSAEQTRHRQFARWGPDHRSENWEPACTIVLHTGAADFARATGKSPSLPGHARIEQVGQTIRSRRIDLRLDDPHWHTSTLPYEVAHLVLTDLFLEHPLPRWAGEAMAIMAQPPAQVARYIRSVAMVREKDQLLSLARLLNSTEYPAPEDVTAFYVQSVSVVHFLIDLKGHQDFVLFLRYGQRYGFEKALERQYGITNFAQLEQTWLSKQHEKPPLAGG